MQVLTANQIAQIKSTATAVVEAAEIVDFAICNTLDKALCTLTSDRALSAYRMTGRAIYHAVMMACAAAFYMGVGIRELWNRFTVWADAYIEQCQRTEVAYQSVEVAEYSQPIEDVWEGELEPAIVYPVAPVVEVKPMFLLPPAKIEPQQEQVKKSAKKRGRPRKAVA